MKEICTKIICFCYMLFNKLWTSLSWKLNSQLVLLWLFHVNYLTSLFILLFGLPDFVSLYLLVSEKGVLVTSVVYKKTFKTLCIFCIYLNTTSLHTWIYHFRITLDPIMLNILYLSINYNLNGLYLQYLIHSNIFYFLFHFHEHVTIAFSINCLHFT